MGPAPLPPCGRGRSGPGGETAAIATETVAPTDRPTDRDGRTDRDGYRYRYRYRDGRTETVGAGIVVGYHYA